jgi:hypothetical protein
MREYESRSPHALAESRAFPELERLAAARSELVKSLDGADQADRARLDDALRRIDRQYDILVAMVKEFES